MFNTTSCPPAFGLSVRPAPLSRLSSGSRGPVSDGSGHSLPGALGAPVWTDEGAGAVSTAGGSRPTSGCGSWAGPGGRGCQGWPRGRCPSSRAGQAPAASPLPVSGTWVGAVPSRGAPALPALQRPDPLLAATRGLPEERALLSSGSAPCPLLQTAEWFLRWRVNSQHLRGPVTRPRPWVAPRRPLTGS